MGISFKIAPGVRVRASSRSVGASVGPRIARVHASSTGRIGMSSGAGPVTVSGFVGGSSSRRRSTASSSSRSSRSTYDDYGQPALTAKEIAANEAQAKIDELTQQHLGGFPEPARRIARPEPVDHEAVEADACARELAGLRWYQWKAKRLARARARAAARVRCAQLVEQARLAALDQQARYDEQLARIRSGGVEVVAELMASAFRAHEYPVDVAAVLADDRVRLTVTVPGKGVLPEKMPGTTAKGNVSLRKMTEQQKADLYRQFVASTALATARRAFAAAPSLEGADVDVLRSSTNHLGEPSWQRILKARFLRADLPATWQGDPWDVLHTVADTVGDAGGQGR